MDNCHSIGTPLATKPKLDVDLSGEPYPPVPKRYFYQSGQVRFRNSLKKHNMDNCLSIGTPLATKPKLDVDLSGEPVDQSDYRSKIGSLMYLTSSRADVVQAVTPHQGGNTGRKQEWISSQHMVSI
ncbi:hypothetical protein Tco_0186752 [Tanacetum coccineum]